MEEVEVLVKLPMEEAPEGSLLYVREAGGAETTRRSLTRAGRYRMALPKTAGAPKQPEVWEDEAGHEFTDGWSSRMPRWIVGALVPGFARVQTYVREADESAVHVDVAAGSGSWTAAGRIVDERGSALRGLRIRLVAGGPLGRAIQDELAFDEARARSGFATAITGENGRYEVVRFDDADPAVLSEDPEWLITPPSGSERKAIAPTRTAVPAVSLDLRVVDPTGAPVDRFVVSGVSPEGEAWSWRGESGYARLRIATRTGTAPDLRVWDAVHSAVSVRLPSGRGRVAQPLVAAFTRLAAPGSIVFHVDGPGSTLLLHERAKVVLTPIHDRFERIDLDVLTDGPAQLVRPGEYSYELRFERPFLAVLNVDGRVTVQEGETTQARIEIPALGRVRMGTPEGGRLRFEPASDDHRPALDGGWFPVLLVPVGSWRVLQDGEWLGDVTVIQDEITVLTPR
jgi:hypothetical protein